MQKPTWSRPLAELAAARTPSGRARQGAFSIEGLRLFERALAAGAPIVSALVRAAAAAAPSERLGRVLDELAELGVAPVPVPDDVFARATDGRDLGGLLGLVALPEPVALGALLAPHAAAKLLVAADVDDPGNVGALVRTALASGALAFVAVGCSDPWHPKAVRTSMGSVLRLPIVTLERAALVPALAEHDVTSWAAVSEGGRPCAAAPRAARTAVVVGSEAFGLPDELARALDERVSIPMPGGVDSFSVNAAAAILLYELDRS